MTTRPAAPTEKRKKVRRSLPRPYSALGERVAGARWVLVSDIDGTLVGDRPEDPNPALGELAAYLSAHADDIVFGVASGRSPRSATEVLAAQGLPPPAFVIGSVGTEIYYGPEWFEDPEWAAEISYRWDRGRLAEILRGFDSFYPQEEEFQTPHKASYYVTGAFGLRVMKAVQEELASTDLRATVVFSHHKFLDFIPYRAGKGRALRFLRAKWQKPLTRFVTCGNSGNDADMLRGDVQGVVVGNYSPELEALRGGRNVYFATAPLAAGVLEGLRHYGLPE